MKNSEPCAVNQGLFNDRYRNICIGRSHRHGMATAKKSDRGGSVNQPINIAAEFLSGELAFLEGKECPINASQDFKRGWETEKMRFEYSQDQSFINKCERAGIR